MSVYQCTTCGKILDDWAHYCQHTRKCGNAEEDSTKPCEDKVGTGVSTPLPWGILPESAYHGHPAVNIILNEIWMLHQLKNADYAGDDPMSNLKECSGMGIEPWKGVLVRISDKYSRLKTFAAKGKLEVKSESVEDTFLDLATYAILGLILYREETQSGKTASNQL